MIEYLLEPVDRVLITLYSLSLNVSTSLHYKHHVDARLWLLPVSIGFGLT